MYAIIFFVYGVGLWYGGHLIIESNNAHPDCIDHPGRSHCFSGGDAMLVSVAPPLQPLPDSGQTPAPKLRSWDHNHT